MFGKKVIIKVYLYGLSGAWKLSNCQSTKPLGKVDIDKLFQVLSNFTILSTFQVCLGLDLRAVVKPSGHISINFIIHLSYRFSIGSCINHCTAIYYNASPKLYSVQFAFSKLFRVANYFLLHILANFIKIFQDSFRRDFFTFKMFQCGAFAKRYNWEENNSSNWILIYIQSLT